MPTDCRAGQLEFEGVGGRRVIADFEGGAMTSDAGVLRLRHADRTIKLIDRVAVCFVDLFLEAHAKPPKRITLDPDATDDPLHGHQEDRFYHGDYGCYCHLPLYVFCGRHLLAAKLRPSNIDASAGAREESGRIVAHIRARWPRVRIWPRAARSGAGPRSMPDRTDRA